jgi:hypothetical protein
MLLAPARSPLPARLRAEVRRDADECGVPPRLVQWLILLPVAGAVPIAVARFHWPLFVWLLREDHPIEWLQFALCMIASVLAGMAAFAFARRRQWLLAGVFVVFCLGMFVLGAEEISWGQRAFAIATPTQIAAENDQEELNLHNLTGFGFDISEAFKAVELLMGLGGALLPFLTRLHPPRLTGELFRALSPPIFLTPLFAFAAAYRTLRFGLTVIGRTPDAAVMFTEWAEVCLYLGLAGLAAFTYASTMPRRGGRHSRVDRHGRPLQASPLTLGVLGVVVAVTAVTVILAIMSMYSPIQPGNV